MFQDVNMMWSLWLELYNSHETSESLQRVYDVSSLSMLSLLNSSICIEQTHPTSFA